MKAQTQKGHLYRKGSSWHVRWRELERQQDGTIMKRNRSQKLADVRDFPRKSEVRPLFQEFMVRLNGTGFSSEASVTFEGFVENVYLRFVEDQKRPSTLRGYRQIWTLYVRDNIRGIRVREFQPRDGEYLMQEIARKYDISKTTLKHIKSWLSGVFTYARRMGVYSAANPMQGIAIPNARLAQATHAYELKDVMRMLAVLPEPARTIVGVAAFAGLRAGEIRGLRWEDYSASDGSIRVSRSVWKRHTTAPKTDASSSTVPVIPALSQLLGPYRLSIGNPTSGWMFASDRLNPIDLDNLSRRVIQPILMSVGIEWRGYHSFRRGLATVLHDLRVDDETIQRVLRHSSVRVTQQAYIKTLPRQVTDAMMVTLEQAVRMADPTFGSPSVRHVN